MVTCLPVLLSDLRSAARFAKPYGFPHSANMFTQHLTDGPSGNTIASDLVYLGSGNGVHVNSEYIFITKSNKQ